MGSLFFVILIVVIICCLIQILRIMQKFLVSESSSVKSFVVVVLSGKIDDIEFVARKYMLKYYLANNMQVVFVDCGLDEVSRVVCEKFCSNRSGIELCPKNQIYSYLKGTIGF